MRIYRHQFVKQITYYKLLLLQVTFYTQNKKKTSPGRFVFHNINHYNIVPILILLFSSKVKEN